MTDFVKSVAMDRGLPTAPNKIDVNDVIEALRREIPQVFLLQKWIQMAVGVIALLGGLYWLATPNQLAQLFVIKPYVDEAVQRLEARIAETSGKQMDDKIGLTVRDPKGPIQRTAGGLKSVESSLTQSVDSATSKFLRFGCNAPGSDRVASFRDCAVADASDTSRLSADFVETEQQTIVFAASPEQTVHLHLLVRPLDPKDTLVNTRLQMQFTQLFTAEPTTRKPEPMRFKMEDVVAKDTDAAKFVDEAHGSVAIVRAADGGAIPATVILDISPFIRTDALERTRPVHTIRLKAVQVAADATATTPLTPNGAARFYVHALVKVNHAVASQPVTPGGPS